MGDARTVRTRRLWSSGPAGLRAAVLRLPRGHAFAAWDRLAQARRRSTVSRITTDQATCDSGL